MDAKVVLWITTANKKETCQQIMTSQPNLDLNNILPLKWFVGQQVLPVLRLDVQLLHCLQKI